MDLSKMTDLSKMVSPTRCRGFAEQCAKAGADRNLSLPVRRAMIELGKRWKDVAAGIERAQRVLLYEQGVQSPLKDEKPKETA